MIDPDIGSLALLALGLGAIVVLAGVLFDWRRLMEHGEDLPLWAFLRHRGTRRDEVAACVGERALRLAEMRCAACGSMHECVERLAAGRVSPVADCPNAALFAQLPSGLTNDSRSDGLKPAA